MIEISLLLIFLFLSFIFSGLETAILGLEPLQAVSGRKERLMNLFQKKTVLVASCLVGNNITIIGAALTLSRLLGKDSSITEKIISFLVEILGFFVLAETLPKSIFNKLGSRILESMYYPILFVYWLFRPLSWLLTIFNSLFVKSGSNTMEKTDIFYFLRSEIDNEYRGITESMLKLSNTPARELMTPLNDIYSLEKGQTVSDALHVLSRTLYSRFPVFEEKSDNIIGYVDVADMLDSRKQEKLGNLLRKPEYVPDSLPADRLMLRMQRRQIPMVFIVSEFGLVQGIVTLEDIAEELVGDILVGEQKKEKETVKLLPSGDYLLDGRHDIDDLPSPTRLIRKDGFETVAGYLMKLSGRIPENGEIIKAPPGTFIIEESDQKTVKKAVFRPEK